MVKETTNDVVLAELRALLCELPFDDDQRTSILDDAAKLPEEKVAAMTRELAETLDSVMMTLHQMDEIMNSSEIRVVHEATAGAAFRSAVPEYA